MSVDDRKFREKRKRKQKLAISSFVFLSTSTSWQLVARSGRRNASISDEENRIVQGISHCVIHHGPAWRIWGLEQYYSGNPFEKGAGCSSLPEFIFPSLGSLSLCRSQIFIHALKQNSGDTSTTSPSTPSRSRGGPFVFSLLTTPLQQSKE
jgi:hypothetical protein